MPGVIFDLDGVIIDSEGLQYESYSRVLAQWDVRVTKEEYAEHWIASGRGPEYAVARFHLPVTPDGLRDLKHPVYHEILHRKVTLMPGAREALERLQRDFPLALATNSIRHDVDFVLGRFDIRRYFTEVITRDDYSGAKPEPDAFLTAARALGLPPSECVVIEDAHKGILAANRAGIAVIAVPNEWTARNDFSTATRVEHSLDAVTAEMIRTVVGSVTTDSAD